MYKLGIKKLDRNGGCRNMLAFSENAEVIDFALTIGMTMLGVEISHFSQTKN